MRSGTLLDHQYFWCEMHVFVLKIFEHPRESSSKFVGDGSDEEIKKIVRLSVSIKKMSGWDMAYKK